MSETPSSAVQQAEQVEQVEPPVVDESALLLESAAPESAEPPESAGPAEAPSPTTATRRRRRCRGSRPQPDEAAAEPAPVEEAAEADPTEELRAALRRAPGDWYVVHSYAGYENRVKTNLETRTGSLNMEDYIFQVEVPPARGDR